MRLSNPYSNLKQRIGQHFKEVQRLKTSPQSIALGFAIGTFIAIIPTPGFGITLALLLILIFKRLSKYAILAALAIFNPFVLTPLYIMSFNVGAKYFQNMPGFHYNIKIFEQTIQFSTSFLLANAIIALAIASVSYILILIIVSIYKSKHL